MAAFTYGDTDGAPQPRRPMRKLGEITSETVLTTSSGGSVLGYRMTYDMGTVDVGYDPMVKVMVIVDEMRRRGINVKYTQDLQGNYTFDMNGVPVTLNAAQLQSAQGREYIINMLLHADKMQPRFKKGDRVEFTYDDGRREYGTVIKLADQMPVVKFDEGNPKWKASPATIGHLTLIDPEKEIDQAADNILKQLLNEVKETD